MSQAPLCSYTPLPQDSPWYFQQAEAPHRLLIVVLDIQFHGTLWFPLKGSLLRQEMWWAEAQIVWWILFPGTKTNGLKALSWFREGFYFKSGTPCIALGWPKTCHLPTSSSEGAYGEGVD